MKRLLFVWVIAAMVCASCAISAVPRPAVFKVNIDWQLEDKSCIDPLTSLFENVHDSQLVPGVFWDGRLTIAQGTRWEGQVTIRSYGSDAQMYAIHTTYLTVQVPLNCTMVLALAYKEVFGTAYALSWYRDHKEYADTPSQATLLHDGLAALAAKDWLINAGDARFQKVQAWYVGTPVTCQMLSDIIWLRDEGIILQNDGTKIEQLCSTSQD